ncbi:hypothetical protein EB155_01445 [archaeon]|nr:hypothetical protein [archaeon]
MSGTLITGGIQGSTVSLTDTKKITIAENHRLHTDYLRTSTLNCNSFAFQNDIYDVANNQIILKNPDHYFKHIDQTKYHQPGLSVQKKIRTIRKKFQYTTGGAYSQNFAHATCFRTKITSKKDNSAFIVKIGLNGEGDSTHDWIMYPVRGFTDTTSMNITDWDHNVARHLNNGENPNSTYEYYCFGYTNIGAYSNEANDYNITPIPTATMEFIDTPNVSANTDIWYSVVLMSSGNHTFFVNSVADSGWRYNMTSSPYYGYQQSSSIIIGTGQTSTIYSMVWNDVNVYYAGSLSGGGPPTFPYTTGGFTYYLGNLRDSYSSSLSSYYRYEVLRTPEGEAFTTSISEDYQTSSSYIMIEEIDSRNLITSESSGIYEYSFS